MTDYFADKNALVQPVIDYQAEAIVSRQRSVLGSGGGVEAWRNMVISAARRTQAKGSPAGESGSVRSTCRGRIGAVAL